MTIVNGILYNVVDFFHFCLRDGGVLDNVINLVFDHRDILVGSVVVFGNRLLLILRLFLFMELISNFFK